MVSLALLVSPGSRGQWQRGPDGQRGWVASPKVSTTGNGVAVTIALVVWQVPYIREELALPLSTGLSGATKSPMSCFSLEHGTVIVVILALIPVMARPDDHLWQYHHLTPPLHLPSGCSDCSEIRR